MLCLISTAKNTIQAFLQIHARTEIAKRFLLLIAFDESCPIIRSDQTSNIIMSNDAQTLQN